MPTKSRVRREPLRPLKTWAETFIPYLLLIGTAMTFYESVAPKSYVDGRFTESLKYTDKAVETSTQRSFDHSDFNRKSIEQEMAAAIGELKSGQSGIDAKLNVLLDRDDDRPRARRK